MSYTVCWKIWAANIGNLLIIILYHFKIYICTLFKEDVTWEKKKKFVYIWHVPLDTVKNAAPPERVGVRGDPAAAS